VSTLLLELLENISASSTKLDICLLAAVGLPVSGLDLYPFLRCYCYAYGWFTRDRR